VGFYYICRRHSQPEGGEPPAKGKGWFGHPRLMKGVAESPPFGQRWMSHTSNFLPLLFQFFFNFTPLLGFFVKFYQNSLNTFFSRKKEKKKTKEVDANVYIFEV